MKFYIEARKSERTGKEYVSLMCDNGGQRPVFVTLDMEVMRRITGMSMRELYLLETGQTIEL